MKTYLFVFVFSLNVLSCFSQKEEEWFYLVATSDTISPSFKKKNGILTYMGEDKAFKKVLENYSIKTFKKTYRNASKKNLKRTFFVIANNVALLDDILKRAPHLFTSGELISKEDRKIYEPNDYGLTSTIGENLGAQVNLDYLDFLGVPKAWYYTTGSRDIIIGISDGAIDTNDIEFKGKSKIIHKSTLSKGHGISVTETAAGQGDNAYGIAGICYDCTIYSSKFGDFKDLQQLVELSNLGVKVINCSWGATLNYPSAQEAINKMFKNGTIIVAAGHNDSFSKTEGEKFYYPASYDNVLSISSAMHRYKTAQENILKGESKNGTFYYANNIRGYVGRNAGFVQRDTTLAPYIYKESVRNLNVSVDLVGPAVGVYRYGERSLHQEDEVSEGSQTSGVAPLVTGTIGLMFSLYPCLPVDEVESILKITSWNIDHIPQNKPYTGLYGSGMLQTGDAVEMVFQLYNENETAYIDNQHFSRWDFKLTSLSKEIIIQNQKFTDSATLKLTAKNRIVIKENTVIKPGVNGKIALKINPKLEKECDLILRDPSILDE
ncbi:S8/S53 family peptidase [Aureisphaera sp. CAU 1614]|uniref:S8/S53 family peptidase n=1 Tax=Halomarinibacterium sedimenti TaxID=2857106 RepID=A0A9X1FRA7_9FLAO|nr:S8/S53 family peptidase [Halomarinibacterium sedimenti]MBW2938903.1 S8/S53 family peptidase [Halomarinibacterium sedimenti]